MADKTNPLRVFLLSNSGPVRRELLRMCGEIPAVKLVGVASASDVPPHTLTELRPDLLLVNLEPRGKAGCKLFGELSRHLPDCKTILLSKPIERDEPRPCAPSADTESTGKAALNAVVDPDDQLRIRNEIQKSAAEKHGRTDAGSLPSTYGSGHHLYDYIEHMLARDEAAPRTSLVRNIRDRRKKEAGRRRAEIARSESVAHFHSFVEQLPGLPYIAGLENQGASIYISPRIQEALGFSAAEWCGDPALRNRQLHPDDRERVSDKIRQAITSNGAYAIDYRLYKRDGALRWFHDEARVMVGHHGRPLFLQGALLDITERKQAQEALERSHGELQDLIRALDSMRAEEQRRLAHEMHDDFGQLLAAMKLDLSTLQRHLPQNDAQSVKYIGSINELVDTMVASVRRIISDLPPKIVEDLGLFNAVKSLARNFAQRHDINCRISVPETEPHLDIRTATAVYRMVQEALNNVGKHAHATEVNIRITAGDESLAVCISDNGNGISEACMRRPGSFGLIGMRERSAALGGNFSIKTGEQRGTVIEIVIPLGKSR